MQRKCSEALLRSIRYALGLATFLSVLVLLSLSAPPARATYVKLCDAGDRQVYWYLFTPTSDLTSAAQKQAIANGMSLWGQVANVKFTETTSLFNFDTLIRFVTGDHGDGSPFYTGGISAHSFPHCYPDNAGDTHFNDAWTWTASPPTAPGELDLTTVAAHESGHVLGLGDSGVIGEMMGLHASVQHYLAWEDIRGVQAIYGRANGVFHLRNSNTNGPSESSFLFQNLGDKPVAGDWNGDGSETIGIWRPSNGNYILRDGNPFGTNYQFQYGKSGDRPVVGDWDGNGTTTAGIFRPSNGYFYLDNTNTSSSSEYWFAFGSSEDIPISGDWNGDGKDTIGMFRPSNGTFYLRNTNFAGPPDLTFSFGEGTDLPIAGDWNGDGIDTIGVYRKSNATFYLRNSNSAGASDISVLYGKDPPLASQVIVNPVPVVADWNNDGTTTVGLYQN